MGNPATAVTGGVTETADCQDFAFGVTNGLDGKWFGVGNYQRWYAALTAGDALIGPADFDVWFYDAECVFIDDGSMANDGDEFGSIAQGAAFAVVDLFFGADADFTFTLTNPCTLPEEEQPEWCEEEAA